MGVLEDNFRKIMEEGDSFSQDRHTERASNEPYTWQTSGGIQPMARNGKSLDYIQTKQNRHMEQAVNEGYISEEEQNWLLSMSEDPDKLSAIEKVLGYKTATGGVLGELDDAIAIIETFTGYRTVVSTAAAVTEGIKQKGGWGLAFSTQEFWRAWSGDLSPHGRTSFRDIIMKGGSTLNAFDSLRGVVPEGQNIATKAIRGVERQVEKVVNPNVSTEHGKRAFASALVLDIFLDPATYITFGVSAGTKISIKATAKTTGAAATVAKDGVALTRHGGRSAEEILKLSTGADVLPAAMTLSPWGEKVYQTASKELIKTQPEMMQKIVQHLDEGVQEGFRLGGLQSMSPAHLARAASHPKFRSAVGEYMVRNYDRLALRTAGFDRQAAAFAGRNTDAAIKAGVQHASRGPGALFSQFDGTAIGRYMNITKGGARDLFKETAGSLHKQRGLGSLANATGGAQIGAGVVAGDLGSVLSGAAVLGIARLPGLAKGTMKHVLPTSAARHIEGMFSAAIERMPLEDAQKVQSIQDGMQLAIEGKKSELREIFSSKLIEHTNIFGKTTNRTINETERKLVARHLDNPSLNLIEEGTPLWEVTKAVEKQFDQIFEQEKALGLVGDKWDDYVTHYYGSKNAAAVTKFLQDSGRTAKFVVEMSGENVINNNRFAMHRIIATFDDAERILGKGSVETDIAAILGSRWTSSLRMQAKQLATQQMINTHKISAIGEGFKNAHSAMEQIGGSLGALSRNYIDTGIPHLIDEGSVRRLADAMVNIAPLDKEHHVASQWFMGRNASSKGIRDKRAQEAGKRAHDWLESGKEALGEALAKKTKNRRAVLERAQRVAAKKGIKVEEALRKTGAGSDAHKILKSEMAALTKRVDRAAAKLKDAEIIFTQKANQKAAQLIKSAQKQARNLPIGRLENTRFARQHNLDMLERVSKSAYNKPLSKLTDGEFDALRDYLHVTLMKDTNALEEFEKIGKMNNHHRMQKVSVGKSAAGIRPGADAHRMDKIWQLSEDELERVGRSISKRKLSLQRGAANAGEVIKGDGDTLGKRIAIAGKEARDIAKAKGLGEDEIADAVKAAKKEARLQSPQKANLPATSRAEFIKIGREALAKKGPQAKTTLRDTIDAGLTAGAKKNERQAAALKAKAKAYKASLSKSDKKLFAEATSLPKRLAAKKQILGTLTAAAKLARRPHERLVKELDDAISALGGQLSSNRDMIARGMYSGKALQDAEKHSKNLTRRIDDKIKSVKLAKESLAEFSAKGDKVLAKERAKLRTLVSKEEAVRKAVDGQQAMLSRILKHVADGPRSASEKARIAQKFIAKLGGKQRDLALKTFADDLGIRAAGLDKAAKQMAKIREANKALGSRQDQLLEGDWMVPEVFVRAIDEAFGHKFNPTSMIDKTLAAWQRFQLNFKVPLTLPFLEHHGRNMITNFFLTASHMGLRNLNPENWRDNLKVVAYVSSVSDLQGKVGRGVDFRGAFGKDVIRTATGEVITVAEIAKQAVMRGINHGFVAHEVDAIAGVFGGLFRGQLIPNVGDIKGVASNWAGRQVDTFKNAAKDNGMVGGTALGAGKVGVQNLVGMKNAMFGGAVWAARKSEHVVDVPFRMALFTDSVKRGKTYHEAAEAVRTHLNDWSRMSKFERKWMRTAIPFYSWIQFSLERGMKDLLENPARISNPAKMVQGFQDAMGSQPPNAEYQSDWMADRVGIWNKEGEELYSRYLLNGLNADEAFRQVSAGIEITKLMAHKISKMTGNDNLAWTVFAPDGNPKDDLRLLSQLDFTMVAIAEGTRGRDFFAGEPISQKQILIDGGYSRFEAAGFLAEDIPKEKQLIIDRATGSAGARFLASILHVREDVGDPSSAKSNAYLRWMLGKTPASRFVSTYERNRKNIIREIKSGDSKARGRVLHDSALEFLGTRAYAYDASKGKVYFQRNRINAVKNALLNAGYYEVFPVPYHGKNKGPVENTADRLNREAKE